MEFTSKCMYELSLSLEIAVICCLVNGCPECRTHNCLGVDDHRERLKRLPTPPTPAILITDHFQIQSTLVISTSKGLSEILRDIRTSPYQICRPEEKIIRTTTINKHICN